MGPRKYKRRRKLKPEELERLRVEDPTSSSSKRETRKRQLSEKDDLYSNDTFDDTDSYVLHETYGFTSTSTSSRSMRDRSATAAIAGSSPSSRVKTEVILHRNSLDAVLDSMDGTLNDDDALVAEPSPKRRLASKSTNKKTRTATSASATTMANTQASMARMIHTKKKVVPAKDGRSKGKTMITQTTNALPSTPSSTEKSSKSKSKIVKKQTRRTANAAVAATTTTAAAAALAATKPVNKSLTNGSSKAQKTTNYDIQNEISQSNLLLELSKKSVHYSPDVVSDLEEILRSPIKSREERSSFMNLEPLANIKISPNYFDQAQPQPQTETQQRNTRSSKRLSIRNLTKELNQVAAQTSTPSTSASAKSTRQKATIKESNAMSMHNIAMHIKQEKEVSYTLNEEPPAVYTCEMCAAEFSDRTQLLVHVPIHI